jgi:hypothetical protein
MGSRGLVAPYLYGRPAASAAKLIEELADPWQARQESRLRVRRGGRDRLRAEGAGPARELVFIDRVIATLVILRFQLPHASWRWQTLGFPTRNPGTQDMSVNGAHPTTALEASDQWSGASVLGGRMVDKAIVRELPE